MWIDFHRYNLYSSPSTIAHKTFDSQCLYTRFCLRSHRFYMTPNDDAVLLLCNFLNCRKRRDEVCAEVTPLSLCSYAYMKFRWWAVNIQYPCIKPTNQPTKLLPNYRPKSITVNAVDLWHAQTNISVCYVSACAVVLVNVKRLMCPHYTLECCGGFWFDCGNRSFIWNADVTGHHTFIGCCSWHGGCSQLSIAYSGRDDSIWPLLDRAKNAESNICTFYWLSRLICIQPCKSIKLIPTTPGAHPCYAKVGSSLNLLG